LVDAEAVSMKLKLSRKARHGRRARRPEPHDHHNVGATQDPMIRAERVAYRRSRIAARTPKISLD
jgi:hypothetical protein